MEDGKMTPRIQEFSKLDVLKSLGIYWRKYKDEKPEYEEEVVFMNEQNHISPPYFYKNERAHNMLGLSFPILETDLWMPLDVLKLIPRE